MSVKITGPILSALLFEHCNADADKEGLLLGTVTMVVTNKISDSDINVVQSETIYNIYSFVPSCGVSTWHGNDGKIKEDALNKMLENYNPKKVVGWYKLRRNSSPQPSMREQEICRDLHRWLQQDTTADNSLVFMLCTSQDDVLYICDHTFMTFDDKRAMRCVPETVISLAGAAQPNYKHSALHVTSLDCAYNKVINKFRPAFVDSEGKSAQVVEISNVSNRLCDKLQALCSNVEDSETLIAKELEQLRMMRKDLGKLQAAETINRSSTLPANFRLKNAPVTAQHDQLQPHGEITTDIPTPDTAMEANLSNQVVGQCGFMIPSGLLVEPTYAGSQSDCDGPPETNRGDGGNNSSGDDPPSILDTDDLDMIHAPCLIPNAKSNATETSASRTGCASDGVITEETGMDVSAGNSTEAIVYSDLEGKQQKQQIISEPFAFVRDAMSKAYSTQPRASTLPRSDKKHVATAASDLTHGRLHVHHVDAIPSPHHKRVNNATGAAVQLKDSEGNMYF